MKIYIVKYKDKIIYVGITKMSFSNRLRIGLSPKHQKGYNGYPWKNLNDVDINILTFDDLTNKYAEAIEAELVYILRNKNNKWPEYQNEIHFRNIVNLDIHGFAESILSDI
jgi:predicted GIY-YIG superfamily endonuclease